MTMTEPALMSVTFMSVGEMPAAFDTSWVKVALNCAVLVGEDVTYV